MFASWLARRVYGTGRTAQRRRPRTARTLAAALPPRLEELEHRLAPATLLVNTAGDNTTSDNFLSLREAILLVNHGGHAGAALGRSLAAPGNLWF